MEIRQLKYFVGIAESGNFSDTSKRFFVSQSAISQQIKALEEELGVQLFTRSTHKVALTENGNLLLPLARNVLRSVEACTDQISDIKGLLCGELNVGLTYSLEPYVREAMLCFMKKHPKVQINILYKSLPELTNKLSNHELDVMFSMIPSCPLDKIESVPLLEYKLYAIMRKEHPLAKRSSLSFTDLQNQPLILPEKGIRDRNAIETYIHKDTGKLCVHSLVNDANAILNIIQEADYISILAEHSIANRPNLCAIPISDLSEPLKVYAHFNTEVQKKRSAEIFVKMFRETSAYFIAKCGSI